LINLLYRIIDPYVMHRSKLNKFVTPFDPYYLLLIWKYLNIFHCIDTSILTTSNMGGMEYMEVYVMY
jgi:hypothetical protein